MPPVSISLLRRVRSEDMIQRWLEMSCDFCGSAEHFKGSVENAKLQAKDHGWIIQGKEQFCCSECKSNYMKEELL